MCYLYYTTAARYKHTAGPLFLSASLHRVRGIINRLLPQFAPAILQREQAESIIYIIMVNYGQGAAATPPDMHKRADATPVGKGKS